MNQTTNRNDDPLAYAPSKVSWATAEFVDRPPAYIVSLFVYSLASCFLVGLIYAFLTEVPVKIDAPGILVPERSPLPILSPVTARVMELKVRNNQQVKSGQVLFVTEDQISDKNYAALKEMIRRFSELISVDRQNRCDRDCLDKLRRLSAEASEFQLSGALAKSFVEIQDNLRPYMSGKQDALNINVLTAESLREIAAAKGKIESIRGKKAQKVLAVELEQLRGRIGELENQIQEKKRFIAEGMRSARDRLEIRLGIFMKSVDEFRATQTIRAPEDGIVSGLSVSGMGQMITSGQKLLDIVPRNSPLLAELDVQNKDIARVSVGQPVRLKIEALSEQLGIIEGSISQLPPGIALDPAVAVPTYKVRAMIVGGKAKDKRSFRAGMVLSAAIIQRRERLLSRLAREIFGLKSSSAEN